MAELDSTDVETFTGGRLSANDDSTDSVLAAALAAAGAAVACCQPLGGLLGRC